MLRSRGPSIGLIIWIVVGVLLAANHHYFGNLNTIARIASALLAILLWPLLLLGINLHIH